MRYNFLLLLFTFKFTTSMIVVYNLTQKKKNKFPIYVKTNYCSITNPSISFNGNNNDTMYSYAKVLTPNPIRPIRASVYAHVIRL